MSRPSPTAGALRSVVATRYVEPLREGGSLPGLVEADDDGLYVLKFRGAGQGPRALVAELIVGELGRLLDLPVPEIVFMEVTGELGRAEPDPEIQDLLRASIGCNLGMDFLPGALTYDPAAGEEPDPATAADLVWFDALTLNVDRTARNPNLLMWHGRLWLIDHGAALYPHHADWRVGRAAGRPFPAIADHVLLPVAASILDADARLTPRLDEEGLRHAVEQVPDDWLAGEGADAGQRRAAYLEFFRERLTAPRGFVTEAEAARDAG